MSDSLCLYNSRVTGSLWINEKCLAKASNVSRLSKTLNMSAHIYPYFVFSDIFDTHCPKICRKSCERSELHIVWKSLKMSHLNLLMLAFSTNLCPNKTDLSGNTVWPQASGFQKLVKMDHFLTFLINFVHSKCTYPNGLLTFCQLTYMAFWPFANLPK